MESSATFTFPSTGLICVLPESNEPAHGMLVGLLLTLSSNAGSHTHSMDADKLRPKFRILASLDTSVPKYGEKNNGKTHYPALFGIV